MGAAIFHAEFGGGAALGRALLALRGGHIAGYGHTGLVFDGLYRRSTATGVLSFDGVVKLGPGVQIMPGIKAGPAGSSVGFRGEADAVRGAGPIAIDLAGQRAELTLWPIGPEAAAALAQPVTPDASLEHVDAFADGLYRSETAGVSYLSRGTLVLCRGRFAGLGELGAVYTGEYHFDPARKLTSFRGTASFRPHTPLITGGRIGPDGAAMPFEGEGKMHGNRARFSFTLAGRSVDAALHYVRPLPGIAPKPLQA